ncbi:HEPN domain-containing protein [Burkholderia gladioli]|uniref:HEPN domain-containing protein n=1 Tax=Burkholderia gladioli TaxID=28095 RepID=UPI00163E6DAB|nr:HEPN domain-containing protein [Burkholderia gladioli]
MSKQTIRTELVSIHNSSRPLRGDAKVIIEGLKLDKRFSISNGKMKFDGALECEYRFSTLFNKSGEIGIHHVVEFSHDGEINKQHCDSFSELIRAFRVNLVDLGADKIERLWDDISFRYCKIAYPIILDVENQMRKLITQFMLRTLGSNWVADSTPDEIKKELVGDSGKKIQKNESDHLYKLDFIKLYSYIIEPYSGKSISDIYSALRSYSPDNPSDAPARMAELRSMLPISNWEKFFSEIVKCQVADLKVKWDRLYKLRCIVAHNSHLSAEDLKEIEQLAKWLKNVIEDAIGKISQVKVSAEDAEALGEMASDITASQTTTDATMMSPSTSSFYWGMICHYLERVDKAVKIIGAQRGFRFERGSEFSIDDLVSIGILTVSEAATIRNCRKIEAVGAAYYSRRILQRMASELSRILVDKIEKPAGIMTFDDAGETYPRHGWVDLGQELHKQLRPRKTFAEWVSLNPSSEEETLVREAKGEKKSEADE